MANTAKTPAPWGDRILPFLPALCVAWSDGHLSEQETRVLCSAVESQGWLTPKERTRLISWLDKSSPPTPEELAQARRQIREAVTQGEDRRWESLTELGLGLSDLGSSGIPPEAKVQLAAALREVEQVLGDSDSYGEVSEPLSEQLP